METNKNERCPNCEVTGPGHGIKVNNFDKMECVVCHKPIRFTAPYNPCDTQLAKNYLKETRLHLTPDAVRDALWTGAGHITHGALARKFRAASTGDNPELKREHYINDKGRTITRYYSNADYKEAK